MKILSNQTVRFLTEKFKKQQAMVSKFMKNKSGLVYFTEGVTEFHSREPIACPSCTQVEVCCYQQIIKESALPSDSASF